VFRCEGTIRLSRAREAQTDMVDLDSFLDSYLDFILDSYLDFILDWHCLLKHLKSAAVKDLDPSLLCERSWAF